MMMIMVEITATFCKHDTFVQSQFYEKKNFKLAFRVKIAMPTVYYHTYMCLVDTVYSINFGRIVKTKT